MKPLIEILLELRRSTDHVFAGGHRCPVLIHRLSPGEARGLSPETQISRFMPEEASTICARLLGLGLVRAKAMARLNGIAGSLGAGGPHAVADRSIVVSLSQVPAGPEGLTIGRDRHAAYSLPYVAISKDHARLVKRERGWAVIDSGSRNGTQVEGEPVSAGSAEALGDGARLELSHHQFLFFSHAGFLLMLTDD